MKLHFSLHIRPPTQGLTGVSGPGQCHLHHCACDPVLIRVYVMSQHRRCDVRPVLTHGPTDDAGGAKRKPYAASWARKTAYIRTAALWRREPHTFLTPSPPATLHLVLFPIGRPPGHREPSAARSSASGQDSSGPYFFCFSGLSLSGMPSRTRKATCGNDMQKEVAIRHLKRRREVAQDVWRQCVKERR